MSKDTLRASLSFFDSEPFTTQRRAERLLLNFRDLKLDLPSLQLINLQTGSSDPRSWHPLLGVFMQRRLTAIWS